MHRTQGLLTALLEVEYAQLIGMQPRPTAPTVERRRTDRPALHLSGPPAAPKLTSASGPRPGSPSAAVTHKRGSEGQRSLNICPGGGESGWGGGAGSCWCGGRWVFFFP